MALHSNRFKPCISRYVRPPKPTRDIDEDLVGPSLPLDMCEPQDTIGVTNENEENQQKESQEGNSSDKEKTSSQGQSQGQGQTQSQTEDRTNTQATPARQDPPTSDQNNTHQGDPPVANTPLQETIDPTKYYEVDRIIRGKYTPDGERYLLKWTGYSSKHNSWERYEDLSPETQESLKEKPVRMFGKRMYRTQDSDIKTSGSQNQTTGIPNTTTMNQNNDNDNDDDKDCLLYTSPSPRDS